MPTGAARVFKKMVRVLGWAAAFTGLFACTHRPAALVPSTTARPARAALLPAARPGLGNPGVPFIANEGQADPDVRFYAPTFGGTLFVTRKGDLVYALPAGEGDGSPGAVRRPARSGVVLTETLLGARPGEIEGEEPAPTRVSVFRGAEPARWRPRVSTFASVSLGEVYDRIEARLQASGHTVEKVFTVRPGGSPEQIRIGLRGARDLALTPSGELSAGTRRGPVTFSAPVAYQETDGQRTYVEVGYEVSGHDYGFRVGTYDRTKDLVIDPILAATFLGGAAGEQVFAMVGDGQGGVYVAGFTLGSLPFPGVGPASADGNYTDCCFEAEAFVARLDSGLNNILAATYLGGVDPDGARALALDGAGNLYVAGNTNSADFPGVTGGSSDYLQSDVEGFVARLDANLSAPPVATLVGGSLEDGISAMVLDGIGHVYVAGYTKSPDLPGITSASADHTYAGFDEAFVTRLDASLTGPVLSTYLGGVSCESAMALALDGPDTIYVGGMTRSPDFPGVASRAADHLFDEAEGFVTRLEPTLSAPPVTTFLGGSHDFDGDYVRALAVGNGSLYAVGQAWYEDFPGWDPNKNMMSGAGFVVRLRLDLEVILGAAFIDGNAWDWPRAIALDAFGRVFVTGGSHSEFHHYPDSTDGSTCSEAPPWYEHRAFVASLSSDLSTVYSLRCLDDHSKGMAIVVDGMDVFVAGTAEKASFMSGDIDSSSADSTGDFQEGFVVKLSGGSTLNSSAAAAALQQARHFLLPGDPPDHYRSALASKIDLALEHAWRGNHRTAMEPVRQAIEMAGRLVEQRRIDESDGKQIIALAEEALAALAPPRREGGTEISPPADAVERRLALAKSCPCGLEPALPGKAEGAR